MRTCFDQEPDWGMRLAANAQALDKSLVALRTCAAQVIEQPAPSRHQLQESPARVVVVRVSLEVVRQLRDTPAEDRDLHFWRTGIRLMDPELRNHFTLSFTRQCHSGMDTPRLVLIVVYVYRITYIDWSEAD